MKRVEKRTTRHFFHFKIRTVCEDHGTDDDHHHDDDDDFFWVDETFDVIWQAKERENGEKEREGERKCYGANNRERGEVSEEEKERRQ